MSLPIGIDMKSAIKELDRRLDKLERQNGEGRPLEGRMNKIVPWDELERLRRIATCAEKLLEFPRPMGDADRIKAWHELAKAVRGNGL